MFRRSCRWHMEYRWRSTVPGENLGIYMENHSCAVPDQSLERSVKESVIKQHPINDAQGGQQAKSQRMFNAAMHLKYRAITPWDFEYDTGEVSFYDLAGGLGNLLAGIKTVVEKHTIPSPPEKAGQQAY